MTADMPDLVKVARQCAAYEIQEPHLANLREEILSGRHDRHPTVSAAIKAARAMQNAMSATAGRGVRVRKLEWTRTERQTTHPFGGPPRLEVTLTCDTLGGAYSVTLCNDAVYFNGTLIKGIRGVDGAQAHHNHRILSALHPAGEKEGAGRRALHLANLIIGRWEPQDSRAVSDEFVALAAVECGLVTPEVTKVLDDAIARYEAMPPLEPAPVTVTPTPDVPGLVDVLHFLKGSANMLAGTANYHEGYAKGEPLSGGNHRLQAEALRREERRLREAADALTALQAEVAGLAAERAALVSENGRRLRNADSLRARATSAEAERDAQRSKIEELSVELAECERRLDADYQREGVGDLIAERDKLKAEVERKDEALREIGEWSATTDSWYRLAQRFMDIARAALTPAKGG